MTTKASCVYGAQMPESRSEVGNYMFGVAAKVQIETLFKYIIVCLNVFKNCNSYTALEIIVRESKTFF